MYVSVAMLVCTTLGQTMPPERGAPGPDTGGTASPTASPATAPVWSDWFNNDDPGTSGDFEDNCRTNADQCDPVCEFGVLDADCTTSTDPYTPWNVRLSFRLPSLPSATKDYSPFYLICADCRLCLSACLSPLAL